VGDAPEIEHDEIIWNCSVEMIQRVEKFIAVYRVTGEKTVPDKIVKTVETLRHLRPVCREIANKFDLFGRQSLIQPKNPIFLRKSRDGASHYWPRIVQDIDLTLHAFNFRNA
jgi:hypothetical protein